MQSLQLKGPNLCQTVPAAFPSSLTIQEAQHFARHLISLISSDYLCSANMIADIPHASTTEDIFSSLEAMRRQEEAGYKYGDYLAQNPVSSPMSGPQCPVDAECRVKMAEWCYQVVDFCHFNEEGHRQVGEILAERLAKVLTE